jgi:RNA polymerase sigma factor FliA
MTVRIQEQSAPAVNQDPTGNELIRTHMPLVSHIVRDACMRLPSHIMADDLESAGMAALIGSARTFEPDRGVPFARFAAIRIRGAVIDELRALDWASRSVRARAREITDTRAELQASLGRAARPAEVAAALGIDTSVVHGSDADVHRAGVLSTDAFAPGEGAPTVADSHSGPEQILVAREQLGYLRDAVELLPERLRFVIGSYFFAQRSMADIAVELGVCAARVSQLRTEALRQLKRGLDAQDEPLPTRAPRSHAESKQDRYAKAIASKGSLSTRLAVSTVDGQALSEVAVRPALQPC